MRCVAIGHKLETAKPRFSRHRFI
uniref:Uncharacterized protein n=1 Tax=Anguilla anguilla TaxID=7936 RepID=A0A0E9TC84_ANGAN